ncbi:hypothetical protein [Marinimicrobium alkaliphilum]|uniref:hypothetical protein n=1 Tax=Marinimicrobium alkaliphilum TaxID=2202654 RepID=UPI001300420C|nr:hypothetical protein [Marinimicrobium alkaliphilum]
MSFTRLAPSIKAIATLLTLFFLTACGGGGGSDEDNGGGGTDNPPPIDTEDPTPDANLAEQIHSLGIAGAQGFVVTGTDSDPSAASLPTGIEVNDNLLEPHTLYKITTDGRLERVPFMDDQGSEIERGAITPTGVREFGPDFVLMDILVRPTNSSAHDLVGLLVNKATGFAYLIPDGFLHHQDAYYGIESLENIHRRLRTDAQGNIYYLRYVAPASGNGGSLLVPSRVDISQLGQGDLSISTIQNIHDVNHFEVSSAGDFVVYQGYSPTTESTVAIAWDNLSQTPISLGSLLAELDTTGYESITLGAIFRGLDDRIYLDYSFVALVEDNYEYSRQYYRLARNPSGALALEDLGPFTGSITGSEQPESGYLIAEIPKDDGYLGTRHIVNGQLTYVATWSHNNRANNIITVDLEQRRTTQHHQVLGLFAHASANYVVSDRHIWLYGFAAGTEQTLIVRYNPTTYETAEINLGSGFELERLEALSSDRVLFEGLRYNPLSNVIALMDLEGNILEESVFEIANVPVLTLLAILPADFIRIDGNPQDWNTDLRVLSGSAGTRPEDSDLVHYSQTQGRGDYLGLVEFAGPINGDDHTRIRFDTHELIIYPGFIGVRATSDPEAELTSLYADSALAFGSALEFSIPASALGASLPDLLYVERYERVRYAAVANMTHDWQTEGEGEAQVATLTINLVLDSPIGDETITVRLSESARIELTRDNATLITNEISAIIDDLTLPETDEAGADVIISVSHESLTGDEEPEVLDPEGIEHEEQLDILQ